MNMVLQVLSRHGKHTFQFLEDMRELEYSDGQAYLYNNQTKGVTSKTE